MAVPRAHVRDGIVIPSFLYGTAWKEDRTEALTLAALRAGFRGIDTANQRRHYFETGVGAALALACEEGLVERADVFLQTKFTHRAGQDRRLPYDPRAPIATQVRQSFERSLEHLRTDYVDALVLHGPSQRRGLAAEDVQAWDAMVELAEEGRAKLLGVSNVTAEQLEAICVHSRVAPTFVQNRCYARLGWDDEVRQVCADRNVLYQGFSLLTANGELLADPGFRAVVERTGATPAQVIFRFALQVGMVPLTGTTSEAHMREDLAVHDALELTEEDVSHLEHAASVAPGRR